MKGQRMKHLIHHTRKVPSRLKTIPKKYRPVVFIIVFSIIGAAFYLITRAATPTSSFEAESSALSGNASTLYDVNASSGQAISFNAPIVPPPPPDGVGIWISPAEIAALPTSGTAWDKLKSTATGALGTVDLGSNTSVHDTNTLALAYYAARLSSPTDKAKVAQEISTVPGSSRTRALEFCRNITDYVIAADVIDLKTVNPTVDASFRSFIRNWVFVDNSLSGHSGGDGAHGTAEKSANNWGGMCRAAYSVTARYLGDSVALDNVTKWHKGFLGDRATYSGLVYSTTTWHADASAKLGINAKGATIAGNNVDGVIPEDQRRTGDYAWPAPQGHYPWEALQGALLTDVVLQRAGKITPNYQDSAMVRAYNWLYTVNSNPASGDDTYQMWIVNKVYGTSFPTQVGVSAGKNMAWTDWTHAK